MSGDIAVGGVWDAFHREVLAYFRRRVGDDATAEDLRQELFVRIHDHLPGLGDRQRLAPWIYTVARNLVIDHYRRSRRQTALDGEPPAAEDSPADNDNQLVGAWLADMIDALPAHYARAVRMAEVDGMTQREVAGALGLSLSGAKSRVQRGRALLVKALRRRCHLEFDRRGNVIDHRCHAGACCGS